MKNGFNALLSSGKLASVRFSRIEVYVKHQERVKEVVGVNCNIVVGSEIHNGASACSPSDKWSVERGMSLALCRALAGFNRFVDPQTGARFTIKDTKDFFRNLDAIKSFYKTTDTIKDIDLIRAVFREWLQIFRSSNEKS